MDITLRGTNMGGISISKSSIERMIFDHVKTIEDVKVNKKGIKVLTFLDKWDVNIEVTFKDEGSIKERIQSFQKKINNKLESMIGEAPYETTIIIKDIIG